MGCRSLLLMIRMGGMIRLKAVINRISVLFYNSLARFTIWRCFMGGRRLIQCARPVRPFLLAVLKIMNDPVCPVGDAVHSARPDFHLHPLNYCLGSPFHGNP